MRRFFILLMIVTAMSATQSMRAQQINKLSVSTQLFLDEQAGRVTLDATEQQVQERASARGITSTEARKQTKWDRPIAEPITLGGQKYISAFVRVSDASAVSELEALGVVIECEFLGGTLYTTLIPVDSIEAVAQITKVNRVNVATKKRPLTDAARQYSNVDDILTYSTIAQTAGLPNAFDGSGVVIGVIDTGIDFQHKAFKDANGNTRIKRAYVYTGSGSAREYGDGASYSITSSAPTTDDNTEDHGTHTSSTAGGSSVILSGNSTTVTNNHGNATYGGMAPGADLYLAGINGLNSTYLANSFQKICNYADQQGKPVVVSNSWGSGYGPHDGTGDFADIVNQYFGDSHPGHICLFAASNDAGTGGYHVSGNATSSSPLGTVIKWDTNYITYYYDVIANAWSRSSNVTLSCKVIVINSSGTKQAEYTVNPSSYGSSVNIANTYVSSGSLQAYRDYVSGSNKSQILLYASSLKMRSGYYLAVQFYPTNGSTVIDVWSTGGYSYFTNTPSTSGYTWTKGTDDMSVSDEATYSNSISIGAYSTKNRVTDYNNSSHNLGYTIGDIADFSSYATAEKSPTGLAYPWICAPGATVVAAVNHYDTNGSLSYINGNSASYGMYRVNRDTSNPYGSMEGTSMATPAAAGIVALWLQAAKSVGKDLTVNDVKEVMKETAIKDSYVTTGSNRTHFGNGKIDALAGIQYILGDATPSPSITVDPTSLTFTGTIGQTYSQTVTVTGLNLEGDISIIKSGNEAYSIDKTTINRNNNGSANATITVTYSPTTAGSTTATLTLKSANAQDVTVTISGTATAPTLTATPNTVTFTAETGETQTANVTVKGSNLLGNVTATLNNGGSIYSINKTSFTQAEATNGTTLTITYKPTTVGNTSASVTLKSANAQDVTIGISGTATAPVPTISTSTQTVNFNTVYTNQDESQSFTITGKNLTESITATLTDTSGVFALNTMSVTPTEALNGKAIAVTFTPKAAQSYTGSIKLTSSGASTVTISLSGSGQLLKVAPVIEEADTNYIKHTSFRADWIDETPAANVDSYTLWVNYVQPITTELLSSINGSDYTGNYKNITLTAPWGGTNTRGGNNAVYFRNTNSYGGYSPGNITYTIPEGYNNATFSMRITTVSNTYGSGNLTVQSNQTAAVGHTFTAGETYTWVVQGSTGERITITSTDNSYSPDMSLIEVWYGDITQRAGTPLRAIDEQGDSTTRTIMGITDRFYIVKDLTAGGTFDYKVKAIYNDGTESDWSNVEQVTLNGSDWLLGDINLDGKVDVTDVNIAVNIILGKENNAEYISRADMDGNGQVDVTDVNQIVNIILGK